MRKLLMLLFVAVVALTARAQYEGTFYVMHSSGCHLAKGASGAVLEAANVDSPQAMRIVPTSDGYYNIVSATDGTFLAKYGANAWNTGFIASGDGDIAKFSFEQDGVKLKIKNKSNSKYLGVDNITAGSAVYCDKNGSDSKHIWFLASSPDATMPVAQHRVIVNPEARRQAFEGFGVSLCWWAHMCGSWSDDKIDEIVDWLVSPEHLNYRVFRYNIGGGDDPANANCTAHHMAKGKGIRAEIPGYKATADADYDWDADSAQIKIMLKIREKRPDAIFEAFSNSAPWWMTYSGCCSGHTNGASDNLRPEYYEAFCHYLVDVCLHIRDTYGIEFASLEPFNEPMSNWWTANGGQEGCHFSVNAQIALIKTLYPILRDSGLNTVISASDENDISQQVKDFTQYANAGVLDMLGRINAHTYNGNVNACSNMVAQCRDAGLPLWMSEVGKGGTGIQGNLTMAQQLIRDLRYMEPEVWCDWQYIEEGNDQWCLVQASFAGATYRRANHFYVRQHLSKYIVPGSTLLTSTNDNTLVAATPDGDKIVLVVVNNDSAPCDYLIDLGMYSDIDLPAEAIWSGDGSYCNPLDVTVEDSYLSFKMQPLSIATIVVPVVAPDNAPADIIYGERYMVIPRNNNATAMAITSNGVNLRPAQPVADRVFTIGGDASAATFTNDEGLSLLATDAYALQSTADSPSTFVIEPVDGGFYRISHDTRSLDLEGEKSVDGTGVGLWAYGASPAASHRQFMVSRVAERSHISPDVEGIFDAIDTAAAPEIAPAPGVISVAGRQGAAVIVCRLDGSIVYDVQLAEGAMDLPVAPGVYVTAIIDGATTHSRVVIVR